MASSSRKFIFSENSTPAQTPLQTPHPKINPLQSPPSDLKLLNGDPAPANSAPAAQKVKHAAPVEKINMENDPRIVNIVRGKDWVNGLSLESVDRL